MSEASGQPAAQTTGGGSILTEGIGNPQGANLDTQQQTTTPATNGTAEAPKGRPEWFPEKFWRDDRPDHEGLAKSYSSLEKLLGSEKVPKPQSDEDQEGWERWYAASGRPKEPKEYDLAKPGDLPDGFYDDTAEQAFRDWSHKNGLNKRQAKNLHEAYVKTQLDRHKAWTEQQRNTREKLRADLIREHGAAYEGFSKAAKAAFAKFADPDFAKHVDETGLGDDPRFIRAFGRIGKAMMGDTALRGQQRTEVNTGDLDAAIAEYRKANHDALMNKTSPEHERHVAKLAELYARRFPDAQ